MLLLFTGLARSFGKGPIAKGPGRFFEPIVVYIRDEIAIPNIGENHYKKYMSFLLTVFFFVWFLNLFGLTDVIQDYLQSGGLIATVIVVMVALFNVLLIPLYFIIAWNWNIN